jgi:hypothetical protein
VKKSLPASLLYMWLMATKSRRLLLVLHWRGTKEPEPASQETTKKNQVVLAQRRAYISKQSRKSFFPSPLYRLSSPLFHIRIKVGGERTE